MSTIVITGATGHIGTALVHQLLERGHRVIAVSRPSDKLNRLQAAGAEIHPVDITTDVAGLTAALRGADAAFLMIPPRADAADFLAYGDGVGANLERAVRESGIKKVVQLSSLGGERPSGTGPIVTVHRLEERLNAIAGVDVLALRPAYFFENFFGSVGLIKGMGINGSAQNAEARIPMIATRDIAAYVAKRLDALDFTGKSVQELLGAREYSMQEATQILGAAIGKPALPYVTFPYADAVQGMIDARLSPSIAGMYAEMSQAVNEHGLFVNVLRSAEATTPTSLEDWAGEVFAPAFE